MKRLLVSLVLAAAICANVRLTAASIIRRMSLAELVGAADEIVVAKVTSVESAWDSAHRRILSTIAIDVEDRWKGTGPSRLFIIQPGGTVGDIEMTVHGTPAFVSGERALLFLQGSTDHLRVVGMSEGRRLVRWDSDLEMWAVESASIFDVVDVGANGRFRAAAPLPRIPLASLRAQVRALAGGPQRVP